MFQFLAMDKEKHKAQAPNDSTDHSKAAFDISETWAYKLFIKSAFKLVEKPKKILDLVASSIDYLYKNATKAGFLQETKLQVYAFARLLKAYAKGQYRAVSVGNVIMIIAALLYLVSPIDFIPDFLIGGFIDDIGIIMWVFKKTREEIEFFLEWEDSQKVRISLDELKKEENDNYSL